jgi:hypothetical protein
MKKLAFGTGGFIVSVVLFAGFSVANYFSSDEFSKTNPDIATFVRQYKLWFYIVIIALFSLQQIWIRWPKPVALSEVEELKDIMEAFLFNVFEEYCRVVKAFTQTVGSVRVNLMLPTWKRLKLGQYIKIYYTHGGLPGVSYRNDELDLRWKKKQGTCGEAWSKERSVIYDSNTDGYKGPEKSLTQQQLDTVGHIKSVLSVPIRHRETKKIVGILNLDSAHNVDKTFFDHQTVVNVIIARANRLESILFRDGVKAN